MKELCVFLGPWKKPARNEKEKKKRWQRGIGPERSTKTAPPKVGKQRNLKGREQVSNMCRRICRESCGGKELSSLKEG